MYHVTKYCNVIGAHCTVRRDKACIRSSPDPSLSCGSGLASETSFYLVSRGHTPFLLLRNRGVT